MRERKSKQTRRTEKREEDTEEARDKEMGKRRCVKDRDRERDIEKGR